MSEAAEQSVYEQENLLARLDRIPFNRKILFLTCLLGIVWLLEAFDIGIIAPVLVLVKTAWKLTPKQVGLVASAGTLGIVIGLLPAGRLADRFGRKTTLLGGIVIFSVMTFLASFSHNFEQLAICRFLAGLGQGAVFPVPYLLLSEFVSKKWRGTAVGLSNAVLGFSYGLNTLIAALIVGKVPDDEAWRILMILGGCTIFIVPVLIKFLPESPRFLLKAGRIDVVRKFVEGLEDVSGLAHDSSLIDKSALQVLQATAHRSVALGDFLRPPYLVRCLVSYASLLSPFIVFYVITIYGPSIIARMGATKENAFYYTSALLFFTVITTAIAGLIGDKISRRAGLTVIMTLGGCGAIALGQTLSQAGTIFVALIVWGLVYAAFPLAKLYMAEQFPTRLRATGSMIGESITRFLTGVLLVYYYPTLQANLSSSTLYAILGGLTVITIVPIALFGVQTSGISVEQAGTDITKLQPQ